MACARYAQHNLLPKRRAGPVRILRWVARRRATHWRDSPRFARHENLKMGIWWQIQILRFFVVARSAAFRRPRKSTQNPIQLSQKQSTHGVGKLIPCFRAAQNPKWTCAHQAQAPIEDNMPKIKNRPKSCIIGDSRPIWLVPDVRNTICSRNDAPDPCASNGGSHVVGRHTGAILRASHGARISKYINFVKIIECSLL